MAVREWTQMDFLKQYGLIVAKKAGLIALCWIPVFFISWPFRNDDNELNILVLFAPMLGAIAGFIAGWYMATDAVEDSSLNGIILWVILVIAAVTPMWVSDLILGAITHRSMHFGGFMLMTAATLLALATAVWHASSQE
jgi:hypothetical protein